MSGGCNCPAAWSGVVPPACPVHNPGPVGGTFTVPSTSHPFGAPTAAPQQYPAMLPQQHYHFTPNGLSDADVERIAAAVVKKLAEAK